MSSVPFLEVHSSWDGPQRRAAPTWRDRQVLRWRQARILTKYGSSNPCVISISTLGPGDPQSMSPKSPKSSKDGGMSILDEFMECQKTLNERRNLFYAWSGMEAMVDANHPDHKVWPPRWLNSTNFLTLDYSRTDQHRRMHLGSVEDGAPARYRLRQGEQAPLKHRHQGIGSLSPAKYLLVNTFRRKLSKTLSSWGKLLKSPI